MPDRTLIDALIEGRAQAEALAADDLGAVLTPVAGRYSDLPLERFGNRDYEGPAQERLTLRIDRMGGVSGDIFKQGATMPGPALGERRDWAVSFFGQVSAFVAERGGRRLFALCEGAAAGARPDGPRIGVVLELLLGAGGAVLAEIKLSQVSETGSAYAYSQQWRNRRPGLPEAAFRKVQIRYAVTQAARHYLDELLPLMDGGDPMDLTAALGACGIDARFDPIDVSQSPYDVASGVFDAYPNRLVRHVLAHQVGPKADWADWQIFVLFAALDGSQARPFVPMPKAPGQPDVDGDDSDAVKRAQQAALGYTLGLAEAAARFRSRFGAVINMAALGAIQNWAPEFVPEARRVAYLARQTVLHELGHAFNLPHPWNRETAHRLLGPSDPGTASVLNYPARYPFGWAAPAVLGQQENWEAAVFEEDGRTKAALLGERTRAFEAAHAYGVYDAAERAFLRHAPFDQIAEGGRSFKDTRRSGPRFEAPRAVDGKRLQIVAHRGDGFGPGNFEAVEDFASFTWNSGETEFPPLPLWVRVVDAEGAPVEIGPVSFGMGLLQLIVMQDLTPDQQRQGRIPEVAAIDPGAQAGRAAGGGRLQGLLPAAAGDPAFDALHERIFWVSQDMLSDALGGLKLAQMRQFLIQVQYYDGSAKLCSQPVRIDVSTYREFPGGKSALTRAKASGDVAALGQVPAG